MYAAKRSRGSLGSKSKNETAHFGERAEQSGRGRELIPQDLCRTKWFKNEPTLTVLQKQLLWPAASARSGRNDSNEHTAVGLMTKLTFTTHNTHNLKCSVSYTHVRTHR